MIPEDDIVQATCLLRRRFDHGQKVCIATSWFSGSAVVAIPTTIFAVSSIRHQEGIYDIFYYFAPAVSLLNTDSKPFFYPDSIFGTGDHVKWVLSTIPPPPFMLI